MMEGGRYAFVGNTKVATRDMWKTPSWLISRLRKEHGWFGLDAAAWNEDTLAHSWLGPDRDDPGQCDALRAEHPWGRYSGGKPVFCNPPYSRFGGGLRAWVGEFARQGHAVKVVAVLPDTPSCQWFRLAWETAESVTLFDGRVAFDPPPGIKASSPRGGTVVFVWTPQHSRDMGEAKVIWDSPPRRAGAAVEDGS